MTDDKMTTEPLALGQEGASVDATGDTHTGPIDRDYDPGMTDSMPSDPVALGIDTVVTSQVFDSVAVMIPGFDPAIHAVNPDGSPKLRSNGAFALKRGRKAGAKTGATGNSFNQSSDAPRSTHAIADQEAPRSEINSRQAAILAWSTFVGVASTAIGPEWQPESRAEEKAMQDTITAYFDAKGGAPDIPPGLALAIAFAGYGFRRYKVPNTADKLKFVGGKVWGWIKRKVLRQGA